MNSQKASFLNRNGDNLVAKIDMPVDGKIVACALFAHCFTCSKNLNAVRNISRSLTQEGIAVLRFDFSGLGESEGEFADTNFSSNVEDLLDAADFMAETMQAPQLLIGHSLGGAAVMFAAAQLEYVKAVVTIGAPANPQHVQHLFDGNFDGLNPEDPVDVNIGGRSFKLKKQFVDDLHTKDMPSILKNLRKATLIMHAPHDKVVGIENAREMYHHLLHPKSFISLDGADHLLSNKADSLYVGTVMAAWVKRYLPQEEEPTPLTTDKAVVARIGTEKYVTEIRAGKHSFIADEPVSVGGKDLGVSPYELVAAGLGACTAMTLRMYADRKKWDLREVKVHLSHIREHAADSADSNNRSSMMSVFVREVEFEGDLDDTQKARLLEIADRCPVHRTLEGDIDVRTTLR
jgi:putative redox protein